MVSAFSSPNNFLIKYHFFNQITQISSVIQNVDVDDADFYIDMMMCAFEFSVKINCCYSTTSTQPTNL